MIPDLVMALQKYSSNTNLTLFKFAVRFKFKFIENIATNPAIVTPMV